MLNPATVVAYGNHGFPFIMHVGNTVRRRGKGKGADTKKLISVYLEMQSAQFRECHNFQFSVTDDPTRDAGSPRLVIDDSMISMMDSPDSGDDRRKMEINKWTGARVRIAHGPFRKRDIFLISRAERSISLSPSELPPIRLASQSIGQRTVRP